jgi:heme/copper-type cytochrome/quinol oxidase subunit 2
MMDENQFDQTQIDQPPTQVSLLDEAGTYARKPIVTGIAGLVVGLFVGLVVLGWWLWPVQWYDAAPSNLHPGYQDWWMRMSIISYGATGDAATAKAEYDALEEFGPTVLASVQTSPGNIDPNLINQYAAAVSATSQLPPQTAAPGVTSTTAAPGATPTAAASTKGRSNLQMLLIVMCVVTLLVGAALVVYFVLQGRKKNTPSAPSMETISSEEVAPTEWTNYPATTEQAPMVQFMASYKGGDDLFDDSFSIDSPSGEFLGECGVGISETIGVGVPKKVTAFEVWLFDKNDIQTVTKVLMSDHAFTDPTIRQKLEAKGEPFQAVAGGQTILETATLRLVARVVDMAYGQGAMPENSYFDSLVLELAIWQKQ